MNCFVFLILLSACLANNVEFSGAKAGPGRFELKSVKQPKPIMPAPPPKQGGPQVVPPAPKSGGPAVCTGFGAQCGTNNDGECVGTYQFSSLQCVIPVCTLTGDGACLANNTCPPNEVCVGGGGDNGDGCCAYLTPTVPIPEQLCTPSADNAICGTNDDCACITDEFTNVPSCVVPIPTQPCFGANNNTCPQSETCFFNSNGPNYCLYNCK